MSSWVVPGYTEVRQLGHHAAGRVALAWHDATGTPVAIRYLSDALRADAGFLRRFRSDARLMSEVDCPNAVRLYEYVESSSGAAVVMELVDGVPLRALLHDFGPTEPQAALAVLKGSLVGLAAAHARGVLHRDYRLENVLVDSEGRSRLTDFGLADPGTASISADLYAAALAFAECLSGASGEPIPVDAAPAPLRPLLARGLAADPAHRPGDAAEFLAELAAAAAAYGPGWEDLGRDLLARRVARAAPSDRTGSSGPSPAGTGFNRAGVPGPARAQASAGGTEPARARASAGATAPGLSSRPRWRTRLAGGIGTVLAAILVAAACLALPDDPAAPPSRTMRNLHPVDTPGATPLATPVAPLVSSSSSAPPRTPRPAGSSVAPAALRITVLRIDDAAIPNPSARVVVVTVTITATTTGQFTLTLHQEGSDDLERGGPDTENPTSRSFPLSGARTYRRTFTLPLSPTECARAEYVLVSAVTLPGSATGAATGAVPDPRC